MMRLFPSRCARPVVLKDLSQRAAATLTNSNAPFKVRHVQIKLNTGFQSLHSMLDTTICQKALKVNQDCNCARLGSTLSYKGIYTNFLHPLISAGAACYQQPPLHAHPSTKDSGPALRPSLWEFWAIRPRTGHP